MSDRGSGSKDRRGPRRRYSSASEDDRKRNERPDRRRSLDRHRKDGGRARDDSRSFRRNSYRSPSPRRDPGTRRRRDFASRSRSPARRRRSFQDDRQPSARNDPSASSRSPPPPKRRRHDTHDDNRRHSTYHPERRTSPPPPRRHRSPTPPPPVTKRSNAPLPSQEAAFKKDPSTTAITNPPQETEKQKPNYAPTGKLAAETNTVANTSIVLKYNEPPEARLPPPSSAWRLYIFKGSDLLETLPLHERSCWLFGRERAVVDFPTEHPSCSKQHAVLQFRYVERRDEWGGRKGGVRPYVIDLESANGTRVNGEAVPESRYVEVRSGDVVRFGESTREYVLMLPPKDQPKG